MESNQLTEGPQPSGSPFAFRPVKAEGIEPSSGRLKVCCSTIELRSRKWCQRRDLNSHEPCGSQDFKSCASASSATLTLERQESNLLDTRVPNAVANLLPTLHQKLRVWESDPLSAAYETATMPHRPPALLEPKEGLEPSTSSLQN